MATETPHWMVRAEDKGDLSILGAHNSVAQHRRYIAQKERFTITFGRELPAILDDLTDLALIVYAADRFIRRRQIGERNSGRSWQRQLEIQLPVSDPERWNQPEVVRLLTEALGFLTEDRWEFSFYPRSQRKSQRLVQHILFPPGPPAAAALFSGGLDSLAGLALQLAEGRLKTVVALTCSTNSRLLRKQRELLRALYNRTPTRLLPLVFPIRLHQHRQNYNLNERSQRGRAFLFNVLGSVAALMAGSSELFIYENGIGSINLPLSEAQLGAQSSRATHPVTLRKIERFLNSLLGCEVHLRLPYLFSTKGEMCARLRASPFANLATRSVSCDGFPPRLTGPEQCGVCTSCLLRRQALLYSGYREDLKPIQYRYDVLGDLDTIPAPRLAPLLDMLTQIDRLKGAVSSPTPWQDLTIEYPELLEVRETVREWLGPTTRGVTRQQLLSLYQDYCREWQCFPTHLANWSSEIRLSA